MQLPQEIIHRAQIIHAMNKKAKMPGISEQEINEIYEIKRKFLIQVSENGYTKLEKFSTAKIIGYKCCCGQQWTVAMPTCQTCGSERIESIIQLTTWCLVRIDKYTFHCLNPSQEMLKQAKNIKYHNPHFNQNQLK